MALRSFFTVVLVVAAASSAAAQSQATSEEVTTNLVLARAALYVQRYEDQFSHIVAQETYEQDARAGGRFDQYGSMRRDRAKRRVFKSDLLLVRPEGATSWIQFRDVFEVDGRAVRDRNDRLAKLFLDPSASAKQQIEKIRQESARYNVGPIIRNVNVPVLALSVLKVELNHRFLFNHVESADAERPDGAWAIDYREVAEGTMIRTNGQEDLPIRGRLRIAPDTGRVRSTTLTVESKLIKATIEVDYEEEESLGILVPRTMRETYRQYSDGASVTGVATYSNFRQFQVQVDEEIAPIKEP